MRALRNDYQTVSREGEAPAEPQIPAPRLGGSLALPLRITVLCVLFLIQTSLRAVEPVSAQLAKESAWTGEAVPLIITLYSPGPFSGTASFDFPDLPLTAVIRGGSPVVGSESIDDETYFTQRHELTIYTQRSGEIVIPAFRVRFSGKKTFTSAAEPMEGTTPELTFESKRPPGTEKLGVVVAATSMQTTQAWAPESVTALNAGDVIQRTIVRRASGTTAMMMTPISAIAPDGVRVYIADPNVQDRTERGTTTAERSDTIKYQFEQAGTFTIPEAVVVWWDADANELHRETLEGRTVSVEGAVAVSAKSEEAQTEATSIWFFVVMAASVGLAGPIAWLLVHWMTVREVNPESLAAGRLRSACQRNDAADAYAAFLNWKRIVVAAGNGPRLNIFMHHDDTELGREVESLTRQLFADHSAAGTWTGKSLAAAFAQARRSVLRNARAAAAGSALAELNPSVCR